MKKCIIEGCDAPYLCKGMCKKHWTREWRKVHVYHWKSNKSTEKWRFGGMRESVIERDGEKCVICGITREAHRKLYGRDIIVHHKDNSGRRFKFANNTMDNLQTLCNSCHTHIHIIKHGKYAKYKQEGRLMCNE